MLAPSIFWRVNSRPPESPESPKSRMQAKRCVGATRLNFLILFLHPRTRPPHPTRTTHLAHSDGVIHKGISFDAKAKVRFAGTGHRQFETLQRLHYFIRQRRGWVCVHTWTLPEAANVSGERDTINIYAGMAQRTKRWPKQNRADKSIKFFLNNNEIIKQ